MCLLKTHPRSLTKNKLVCFHSHIPSKSVMLFHNISRTGTTTTYKHLVACMYAHMRLNSCVCHERRTEERTAAWPFWWKWIRDVFLGWLWCVKNQHYSSFNHTSIWSGPRSECEMCLEVSRSVQQLCNRLTPLLPSLSFSLCLFIFILLFCSWVAWTGWHEPLALCKPRVFNCLLFQNIQHKKYRYWINLNKYRQ